MNQRISLCKHINFNEYEIRHQSQMVDETEIIKWCRDCGAFYQEYLGISKDGWINATNVAYENLKALLLNIGFTVIIRQRVDDLKVDRDGSKCCIMEGRNIKLVMFGTILTNGRIYADHKSCFDKLQKCPLCLELPRNQKQEKELLMHFDHLGSREGYRISNEYLYLDNNPYKYS